MGVPYMFEMKIWVKIDPNKQAEFEQAIQALLDIDYFHAINSSFDLLQPIRDKLRYCYSESWNSMEAFENHKNSDQFRAFLGAMKVLGDIYDSKLVYFAKEEPLNIE